jgi:hypothetical protein
VRWTGSPLRTTHADPRARPLSMPHKPVIHPPW